MIMNSRKVISFFRIIIGGLFFYTGISKIFVFQSFIFNIGNLSFIPLSPLLIEIIGIGVIIVEILAGVFLIFEYKVEILSLILAALVLIFTAVISYNYFKGNEIVVCNCFGILPIRLDAKVHLIFNLVLLSLIFFLYADYLPSEIRHLKAKKNYIKTILFLNVILVVVVIIVHVSKENDNASKINFKKITDFADTYFTGTAEAKTKNMILFVDFADFSCLPCSESISFVCKELEKKLKAEETGRVLIVVRKEKGTDEYYNWLIRNWRQENSIIFLTLIDENNIFGQSKIVRSSIVVLGKDESVIEFKELPLNRDETTEVISELLN